MKLAALARLIVFTAFLLFCACGAGAISTLDVIEVTSIDAGNDIVFAEIADNSDSVIFLKKDFATTSSTDATADDWSFFIYSLTRAETMGIVRNADPAVFYGFSPGPANSVLFTRKVAGVKSIYSSSFNVIDSALLVNQATYPAYVATGKPFNFAYVKDSDNIYVGGLLADSPTLSVPAGKIFDLSSGTGAVRFMRWSPDANSLVFMLESTGESTAAIYMLTNVQNIAASNEPITSLSDTSIITKITNDTYYNAFPHFAGGDQFILYNRANPSGNFKFSNFADTGGCTSIILTNSNWDAVLYERNGAATHTVDTSVSRATVSAAANHRGYILLVRDNADTEGDLDFAVLSSTVNVTASSSGTFYFPTNARLVLEAGAVPTSTFTVVGDTPKSTVRRDTPTGDIQAIIVPVHISSTVPGDSMDKIKITVQVLYQDLDLKGFAELATKGVVRDTGSVAFWRPSGSVNTSGNLVNITPPHFSAFGVGVNTVFNVIIQGQSCLIGRIGVGDAACADVSDIGRRAEAAPAMSLLRRLRDSLLGHPWGRRAVKIYYGL